MSAQPQRCMADGRQLAKQACPVCGYEMDSVTCLTRDDARPKPGDLTLCLCCGEIFTWDERGSLVVPSVGQLMQVMPSTLDVLEQAQRVIRRRRFINNQQREKK